MSEVQYTLKAFRYDHIGAIHEREMTRDEDHQTAANDIADRFGLGAKLKTTISGKYLYEDGEIITYFRWTPLR